MTSNVIMESLNCNLRSNATALALISELTACVMMMYCCSVIDLFSVHHQYCPSCVGAMCQLVRKTVQRAAVAAETREQPPTPPHAAAPSAAGQRWTRSGNAPLGPQAPHTAGKAPQPLPPPPHSRTIINTSLLESFDIALCPEDVKLPTTGM